MKKHILILGAGFGGLEAATSLREKLDDSYDITLIDKKDFFTIGFTKFDVMFGRRKLDEVKSYYKDIAASGVNFVQDNIEQIDPEKKHIKTTSHSFSYDILIIALGADTFPEAIPGFVEGGYEFYSLKGADKVRQVINNFEAGRVFISIFDNPYKCPPAPYEAAFQLHDYFNAKGIRDNVELKILIPGPMPLPIAKNISDQMEIILKENNIELLKGHKVVEIKPEKKEATLADGKSIGYDLFLGIPIHKPPQVVRESVLGENGWISVNRNNLETKFENVYAIGDVVNIPIGDLALPKSGVVAEDAAKVIVSDILNKENAENNHVKYEAVGICYVEFTDGKVGKLSGNFLGKDEPELILERPLDEFRQGKINFEKDRIFRWFK